MKTIALNHASTSSVQPVASLLLTVASLFFLVMVGYAYWLADTKADVKKSKQQITARQQNQPTKAVRLTGEQHEKNREIRMALDELVLPWHALFKALETANHEGIQMLAVEPSAKTNLVRLRAIAFDTDSMMRYLSNLNQQENLQQVRLISHQIVEVNGNPAVEMVAEAIWKS